MALQLAKNMAIDASDQQRRKEEEADERGDYESSLRRKPLKVHGAKVSPDNSAVVDGYLKDECTKCV